MNARGKIVSWRDDGGTQHHRWFRTESEASMFAEQIVGAPGVCDYLSDILGELEAHRAELERIGAALDRIADLLGAS